MAACTGHPAGASGQFYGGAQIILDVLRHHPDFANPRPVTILMMASIGIPLPVKHRRLDADPYAIDVLSPPPAEPEECRQVRLSQSLFV